MKDELYTRVPLATDLPMPALAPPDLEKSWGNCPLTPDRPNP